MALLMNSLTMLMACQQQLLQLRRRQPYANCNCDALLAFGVAAASASVAAAADDDDENDLDVGIVAVDADTNSIRDSHLHTHDYLCRIESVVYLHWPLAVRILAVDCWGPLLVAGSSHFSPLLLVFVHLR